MSRFVLALDQGTTSSRAMLFDHAGRAAASSQQEFPQILPQAGHVEHDPEVLWSTQLAVARDVLRQAAVSADEVAAIGVANQRETTILWERSTGRPVANAIVWQSRVSAGICETLREQGYEDLVRSKTGLVIDAYFSGSKIKHLFDTIPGLRSRAERGEVLFGTVDTWLIWKLTGGRAHVTDCSNASRTMLFDIHTLTWDDELLRMLDIPRAILPEVRSSSEVYGHTDAGLFGRELPIAGTAGDQQAATFGQACFEPGSAKNTYGTGCFMLLNTGHRPVASNNRLLSTVGWRIGGKTTYCLEASIFVAGAVVSWLRDGLGLIASSTEAEQLAASVPDSGGAVFVPALVGLGAPYWDPNARGTILGITRGTTKAHICRAAIDSMALQTCDVLEAMQSDAGTQLAQLKVDGGAAVNNRLMQLQADLLGTTVRRPTVSETTALGAAYLAGLAVGFWRDLTDVARNWALDREFHPTIAREAAAKTLAEWRKAVGRSQDWASEAH